MSKTDEFNPGSASWPVRAYYTPVSDALRGRLSGRLDMRRVIAAAGLPAPLAELVYQVVRRSRLWHSERLDVARELCAHFDDGLATGRSVEQLVADFGAPKLAARLIHQAKLRNRPLWWQAYYYVSRAFLVALAIGLLLYAAVMARFYLSRPSISHNYWNEINAARELPEQDRAWPLYREAAIKLGGYLNGEIAVWADEGPSGKHWPDVLAELELRREVLELARLGAQKPKLGLYVGDPQDLDVLRKAGRWVVSEIAPSAEANSELMSLDLTPIAALRELARLLAADARRAALAGDGATTLADLTTLVAMSEQVNQPHRTFVEQLVALGIFGIAMETTGYVLADAPQTLSDDQLMTLSRRIAQYGDANFALDMSAERMYFADILQRTFTDDGHGSGRVTRAGLDYFEKLWKDQPRSATAEFFKQRDALVRFPMEAAVGQFIGTRRENELLFDSLMKEQFAVHQGPPWLWDPAAAEAAKSRLYTIIESSPQAQLRYLPVSLFVPAIYGLSGAPQRAWQERDGTLVAIALVLWQRRHGTWPQRLDELVPELLPAVPLDRFDGQPLRYVVRDGRPIVYSIGINRQDDGGTPPFTNSVSNFFGLPTPEMLESFRTQQQNAGDWILWPPTPPKGLPD